MDIDHTSMETAGRAVHTEGGEFLRDVNRLSTQVGQFIPYFGNPSSDEAARLFRQGEEGQAGFDQAYEDLSKALSNLGEAYRVIGSAVVAMSKNVKAADLASTLDDNPSIKELFEFAERKNDDIAVPTTPVERA